MKNKDENAYAAMAVFSVTLWEHLTGARVILWVVYKTYTAILRFYQHGDQGPML
jgi:hypothetical protein